jgi:hypothetical protein
MDLYTPMLEDDIFPFSAFGSSAPMDTDDNLYDYPYTPVSPTIPLISPAHVNVGAHLPAAESDSVPCPLPSSGGGSSDPDRVVH